MEGFVLSSLEVGRVAANLLDHVVDFLIVAVTRAQVVTQRLLRRHAWAVVLCAPAFPSNVIT